MDGSENILKLTKIKKKTLQNSILFKQKTF